MEVSFLSLENGIIESSLKGGLGVLIRDLFLEASDKNLSALFISIAYPKCTIQEFENEKLVEKEINSEFKNLKKEKEIKLNTAWYPVYVTLYSFKKGNTIAYFLGFENEKNEKWLRELKIYGEKDEGQIALIRFVFSEISKQILQEFKPSKIFLNESDTALILKYKDEINSRFIFVSHTPLSHGHKRVSVKLLEELYGQFPKEFEIAREYDKINLGKLAAHYAEKIVTVSKMHQEITKNEIYPEYSFKVTYITNGVHSSWISEALKKLFDKKLPSWKSNPNILSKIEISKEELEEVHKETKNNLIEFFEIKKQENELISNFRNFDINNKIFTFAKRLTEYKRGKEFLKAVSNLFLYLSNCMIVFSGPNTGEKYGEETIENIFYEIKHTSLPIAYLLNYNISSAQKLVQGSDFWINIPISNKEASGTSWMKALVNGKIVITTPAGSVPEGIIDNYNGIVVSDDLSNLIEKLKLAISLDKEKFLEFSLNAIKTSPYFLTSRVIREYLSL